MSRWVPAVFARERAAGPASDGVRGRRAAARWPAVGNRVTSPIAVRILASIRAASPGRLSRTGARGWRANTAAIPPASPARAAISRASGAWAAYPRRALPTGPGKCTRRLVGGSRRRSPGCRWSAASRTATRRPPHHQARHIRDRRPVPARERDRPASRSDPGGSITNTVPGPASSVSGSTRLLVVDTRSKANLAHRVRHRARSRPLPRSHRPDQPGPDAEGRAHERTADTARVWRRAARRAASRATGRGRLRPDPAR